MEQRQDRKWSEATPTVDTSAYADGDLIGTKLTFSNIFANIVEHGLLRQVQLLDKVKQGETINLVLFSEDPDSTTFTDNAAFAVHADDLDKVCAVIPLTTHQAFSVNGVSYADNLQIPVRATLTDTTDRDERRTLYGALVSGGTPNYSTASDLTVRICVQQD